MRMHMSVIGTQESFTEYKIARANDSFNPDNRHSHNQGRTSGVDPKATFALLTNLS